MLDSSLRGWGGGVFVYPSQMLLFAFLRASQGGRWGVIYYSSQRLLERLCVALRAL